MFYSSIPNRDEHFLRARVHEYLEVAPNISMKFHLGRTVMGIVLLSFRTNPGYRAPLTTDSPVVGTALPRGIPKP